MILLISLSLIVIAVMELRIWRKVKSMSDWIDDNAIHMTEDSARIQMTNEAVRKEIELWRSQIRYNESQVEINKEIVISLDSIKTRLDKKDPRDKYLNTHWYDNVDENCKPKVSKKEKKDYWPEYYAPGERSSWIGTGKTHEWTKWEPTLTSTGKHKRIKYKV
jgi:hypothetical protein